MWRIIFIPFALLSMAALPIVNLISGYDPPVRKTRKQGVPWQYPAAVVVGILLIYGIGFFAGFEDGRTVIAQIRGWF